MLALLAAAALVVTSSGRPAPATLSISPVVDGGAIASIAALNVGAWWIDRRSHADPCPCDPASVPGFDRVAVGRRDLAGARASDVLQYGAIVGAPLLAFVGDPGAPRERVEAGLIAIEAMSVAGSTTQFLKAAVRRPRPASYGVDAMPPFAYTSWPSGHATGAFSAASAATTIWALRHPRSPATPWIAAGAFAVAGATAFLRVEAGRHFPSDVVAGAAIGTAAGWAIPMLHARTPVQVAIAPDGFALRVSFGRVR